MQKTASDIESVLVYVGLDRLGDGLLKLPFVHGLKDAFPNAKITWFAGKETTVYARALAPLAESYLDEIIEYGGVGVEPKELLRARPLKGRRFDLIIDTQKIVWTSLSARRIRHGGFVSPAARFLLSSKKPPRGYKFPKAMQRQMLDLLEIASGQRFPTPDGLQINIPANRRDQAAQLLPAGPTYVGFAPGSGGRPKCWPLQRYVEVAKHVAARGETPVFIIGPQEGEWVCDITSALPDAVLPLQMGAADHGFDPMLTLALGERLSKAVSNDSGIAHMLAVAGTPLAALYGPTVYEKFPPMTEHITVIKAEKFGSRDMSAIPIDAVNQALDALPGRAPDA